MCVCVCGGGGGSGPPDPSGTAHVHIEVHMFYFPNKSIHPTLNIVSVLANSVEPDKMQLGFHCLPKYSIRSHHYTKRRTDVIIR